MKRFDLERPDFNSEPEMVEHPIGDWVRYEDMKRMESYKVAWMELSSRLDEAHDYCRSLGPETLGRNVWHVILDDALRRREGCKPVRDALFLLENRVLSHEENSTVVILMLKLALEELK